MVKTITWRIDYGWNRHLSVVGKDIYEALEKGKTRIEEKTKDNNIESNKKIWGATVEAIALDNEADDDD